MIILTGMESVVYMYLSNESSRMLFIDLMDYEDFMTMRAPPYIEAKFMGKKIFSLFFCEVWSRLGVTIEN